MKENNFAQSGSKKGDLIYEKCSGAKHCKSGRRWNFCKARGEELKKEEKNVSGGKASHHGIGP